MNIKELNFSELEKIDENNKQKLNFVNGQINRFEEFLKKSTFDSYDYICPKSGGNLIQWNKEEKQIVYIENGEKRHLLGCSAAVRNIVYNDLQDFINELINEYKGE